MPSDLLDLRCDSRVDCGGECREIGEGDVGALSPG